MKPESGSLKLLAITRSKAKMLEYHVPEEYQNIDLSGNPSKLFMIAISLLGDVAAGICRNELDSDGLVELRRHLPFSARFFDSYHQSELHHQLEPYLVLCGAAAYYFCDQPGNATVLTKIIRGNCPDLECDGLEDLLLAILRMDESEHTYSNSRFSDVLSSITRSFLHFMKTGEAQEDLRSYSLELRDLSYASGSPRQLLFSDIIGALIYRKIENSSWVSLPKYTEVPVERWSSTIQKETFPKELWPAQHLLGQADILKGVSAVIQMPTSAGKTKASELIIRSAFLKGRTSLAVIIAPFRALCHEIRSSLADSFLGESTSVDELSDTPQTDFTIADLLNHNQILVVTPEKFQYVVRQSPDLAANIGLIIFDEGHQFDGGSRGITYELLLTSLRAALPAGAQKILISAVISNAVKVGEWLNGSPKVVEGSSLNPTFKSLCFVSWQSQALGTIQYVDNQKPDTPEFFVPRVIESIGLQRKARESKIRFFPNKADGHTIALFLGLKLCENGGVAVFCAQKRSVGTVCKKMADAIDRGLPLVLPLASSNQQEVRRIRELLVGHIGPDAPESIIAEHGIFTHHASTPQGIRHAVEYAMKEDLIRMVICTSTLAQGVNLPIRYLIITSIYQDRKAIKTRDFHNLIGRAGRAGMHTEGSILFADPDIYDNRNVYEEKWRWDMVKNLLDPNKSEPCVSNLLSIFDPIQSDDCKSSVVMKALDFAIGYTKNPNFGLIFVKQIVDSLGDQGYSIAGVTKQIDWRINLISAIEGYLISHWDDSVEGLTESDILRLAEDTLAYFLADENTRENIKSLFKLISSSISTNLPEPERRRAFGKTLLGVNDAKSIEAWVQSLMPTLLGLQNIEQVLPTVWPILTTLISNSSFQKIESQDALRDIAMEWISGKSFISISDTLSQRGIRMARGKGSREIHVEDVIDLCEGGFAYDGALVLGAVIEFMSLNVVVNTDVSIQLIKQFQKHFKYGLPSDTSIGLFELGFADRIVCQDLANSFQYLSNKRRSLIRSLNQNRILATEVIQKYPAYFQDRLAKLVSEDQIDFI